MELRVDNDFTTARQPGGGQTINDTLTRTITINKSTPRQNAQTCDHQQRVFDNAAKPNHVRGQDRGVPRCRDSSRQLGVSKINKPVEREIDDLGAPEASKSTSKSSEPNEPA